MQSVATKQANFLKNVQDLYSHVMLQYAQLVAAIYKVIRSYIWKYIHSSRSCSNMWSQLQPYIESFVAIYGVGCNHIDKLANFFKRHTGVSCAAIQRWLQQYMESVIYVCIHINEYIYTYTYVYIYVCVYIYMYIYTYTHTYVYIYKYIYVYGYIPKVMQQCNYTYVYICIHMKYTQIYIYTYIYIIYIYIYIHIYTYMYACIYIYIISHAHIYIYKQKYIYVWLYTKNHAAMKLCRQRCSESTFMGVSWCRYVCMCVWICRGFPLLAPHCNLHSRAVHVCMHNICVGVCIHMCV